MVLKNNNLGIHQHLNSSTLESPIVISIVIISLSTSSLILLKFLKIFSINFSYLSVSIQFVVSTIANSSAGSL